VKRWLNSDETVEYLSLASKDVLYRLMSDGDLPYYKPHRRLSLFDAADLDAWVEAHRVEARAS
jgi:excisionase family DNA binding protein